MNPTTDGETTVPVPLGPLIEALGYDPNETLDEAAYTPFQREISGMMDALTARLLLVPWDGHPPNGSLKS